MNIKGCVFRWIKISINASIIFANPKSDIKGSMNIATRDGIPKSHWRGSVLSI